MTNLAIDKTNEMVTQPSFGDDKTPVSVKVDGGKLSIDTIISSSTQNRANSSLLNRIKPHWQEGWSPKDQAWRNGLYNISKIAIEVLRSILFLICFVPLKAAYFFNNTDRNPALTTTTTAATAANSPSLGIDNKQDPVITSNVDSPLPSASEQNDKEAPSVSDSLNSKNSKRTFYKYAGMAAVAVAVGVIAYYQFFSSPAIIEEVSSVFSGDSMCPLSHGDFSSNSSLTDYAGSFINKVCEYIPGSTNSSNIEKVSSVFSGDSKPSLTQENYSVPPIIVKAVKKLANGAQKFKKTIPTALPKNLNPESVKTLEISLPKVQEWVPNFGDFPKSSPVSAYKCAGKIEVNGIC